MPKLNPTQIARIKGIETDPRRVLGHAAREIRLQAGANLEQMTATCRRFGLPWTTGRVGDLESGRVDLKIDTLLSVALVLGELRGSPVALTEMLPLDAPLVINGVEIESLQAALRGEPVEVSEGQREHDRLNSAEVAPVPQLADKRTAKALDIPVDQLMDAANDLWGHPLSVERDRRSGPESTTAERGQITTELRTEVREHLAKDTK